MLDDPRVDRTKRHELVDIVVIAILAVICGSDGWDDIKAFGRCFASLVAELAGHVEGKLVCIDGKTMRRTFARERGQGPLHLVSAWVADNAVTLGQVAVEAKSNEIPAIPELLAVLDLRGASGDGGRGSGPS